MASAVDEAAGLDKVLTRLALTDEDKLERVRGPDHHRVTQQGLSNHNMTSRMQALMGELT